MKIKSVHVRKQNLSLTRPYTIAFKTIDSVENGIIELVTDTGLRGYGAFNPSFEVTGEKLDNALEVLTQEHTEWMIGKELIDLNKFCADIQHYFFSSISARTGMEIAAYDLFAKMRHVPLTAMIGQHINAMPTSITIGIKNTSETVEEAKEYIGRKFRILKVKLGKTVEEDIERIIKLREEFKNSIDIIIDANQGYDEVSFLRFHQLTKSLNIGLIEQPFKCGKESLMRKLPDKIKNKIAADESLLTPADAINLVSPSAACGYFNIKLMKCGGITEALKIVQVANHHKIGLMWGCNDESIISITAALHLAFSCYNTKYIDLDGSLDLSKDVVKGGFILKDGIMSLSNKPGLGVEPLHEQCN